MPSTKIPAAVGRLGAVVSAVTLLLSGLHPVLADHGAPAPARTGSGWLSWLLVAGAVVAVGLAAWAFFAPDHADGASGPPGSPGPEPPTR